MVSIESCLVLTITASVRRYIVHLYIPNRIALLILHSVLHIKHNSNTYDKAMAESFATFLYDQLIASVPDVQQSLVGKTAIITGSNTGLGKEAARKYATLGVSRLILAVRNTTKGEEARQDILNSLKVATAKSQWVSQGPTGGDVAQAEDAAKRIQVWELDLGSYESVQAFAARCERELERIDIVIENAGIATYEYALAEDNESTVTVNVISTFLLANLLVPKLKETAKKFNIRPTLTIVSSGVHYWAKMPERKKLQPGDKLFDVLNNPEAADMKDRYNVSKLLEVFYCREFAAQHSASTFPVTLNFVDPGFCWSTLSREEGGWTMYLARLALARTTEQGSRTLASAGMSGQETHGQFLASCKPREVALFVTSEEGQKLQKMVYQEVNEKLEKIQTGVTKV